MKTKILMWLFLLTFAFIFFHNLFYLLFDQEESVFFILALLSIAGIVVLGMYVLFYEIVLKNKDNKRTGNSRKKDVKIEEIGIRRKETFGERFADKITAGIGSWKFIIIQSIILSIWMILNVVAWTNKWDPYPFILLNLVLSFQAAYAAPIIMMSQNRTATRDRKKADWDLATDRRAERGIAKIQKDFVRLERKVSKILKVMEENEGRGKNKRKSN